MDAKYVFFWAILKAIIAIIVYIFPHAKFTNHGMLSSMKIYIFFSFFFFVNT